MKGERFIVVRVPVNVDENGELNGEFTNSEVTRMLRIVGDMGEVFGAGNVRWFETPYPNEQLKRFFG